MPLLNDADNIMFGATQVDAVYLGDEKVWPSGPPAPSYPAWLILPPVTTGAQGDAMAPGHVAAFTQNAKTLYINVLDAQGVDHTADFATMNHQLHDVYVDGAVWLTQTRLVFTARPGGVESVYSSLEVTSLSGTWLSFTV